MSNESSRKKSKPKKKKVSLFRVFLITFLILSIVITASGMGIVFGIIKNAKPIDPNNLEGMLDESSFIYDKNGELVEKVHGNNFRSIVELDKIPVNLQNAFISIEDERFYKHHGIDVKRLFGALWYDLKTLSKAQGASTITQQLAKNIYTSNEKTISRKIKDAYYALQLEKDLEKTDILRAYLNTIYLGRGAVGVQAAAQTYFSKDVSELNLAESAMIAGITKYPSKYSPFTTERLDGSENLEELKDKLIFYPKTPSTDPASDVEKGMFKKLLSKGLIDNYQYEELTKEQIVVRKAVLNSDSKERQEIVLRKMLELGHINQSEYEEAKNQPISIKIPRKKASGISSYFADLIKDEVIDALVKKEYSEDEARDLLYNGGLRIYSTMDMEMQKILEKEYENSANFPGTFRDNNGNIQPQSAMVIMDHHTGEVRALVGGRMIGGSRLFNRATNPRQPGSSIKPLAVYLPALDNGMNAATGVDDSPRTDKKGKSWPKNYGNKYRGDITLRESVQWSSNVGAVRVAEMLSMNESSSIDVMMDYLENMGISTLVKTPGTNDKNLSLSLGGMTKGVTPLELTAAYGTMANKGTYIKPRLFTKVEGPDGEILLENKPIKHKVVSPQTAYIMTDILKTVVSSGTGGSAKLPNMPVAGKTGTTSNNYDAWFAGYTPYYVAATWIGNDINKDLGQGSKISAKLWNKVMSKVHSKLEYKNFEKPEGIIEKTVCTHSGDLATHFCPTTRTEIFAKGSAPQEYCKLHTQEEVADPSETDTPSETPSEIIDKWLFENEEDNQGQTNPNQTNQGQNKNNQNKNNQGQNSQGQTNQNQNNQNKNTQNTNNPPQNNQNNSGMQILEDN